MTPLNRTFTVLNEDVAAAEVILTTCETMLTAMLPIMSFAVSQHDWKSARSKVSKGVVAEHTVGNIK